MLRKGSRSNLHRPSSSNIAPSIGVEVGMLARVSVCLVICALAGCVVNPVTGEREIGFVSSAQEIAIGREQYIPAQQMQGGAYRTDAELATYVSSVGNRVAQAAGVDLPYEFVILNSSVPNAWALPGGKIALNRGLLVQLRNEAELAAVLGHEIGHAALRHGAKRIERGYVTQGTIAVVAIGTSGRDYAGDVLGGAQLAAGLLNQTYSRNAEREADYYGTEFMAKAGYDPYAAVTLQETFVRLSGDGETDWVNGLFASHPPSTERVSNNRVLVSRLKGEGYTGEFKQAQFASAMTSLRSAAAAYDEYDSAVVLYDDGEYDSALRQVNVALQLEDNEALFHGLRGSIRLHQQRYGDSITNFNRAIERDPSYFVYYLNRGIAQLREGSRTAAKSDLTRSLDLLPTAGAYQALGELAEAEGDQDAALRYYAAASKASGEVGRTAFSSMLRIDLPNNPANYVQASVLQNPEGQLVLRVVNLTPVNLAEVQLRVEVQTANGVQNQTEVVAHLGPNQTLDSMVRGNFQAVQGVMAYAVGARLAN